MNDKQTPPAGDFGLTDGLGAWVLVAERLPDLDVPVWIYCDGDIFVACRSDDGDGWLWCNCYDSFSFGKDGWTTLNAEADDDYRPTLWQPLPEPPRYTQAELDAAAARGRELAAAIKSE